ncbi:pilus assembly protein [Pokkaliibacter sp. CJK22405]|uniref:pilus assembly protein n=1 Tax=Pokkaliibacter sp. CJK22405 TaxID=3384615 RepID=UPI0039852F17
MFARRLGWWFLLFSCLAVLGLSRAWADISQTPFVSSISAKPKMMLLLSKDHELFKKAYPDYTDLDGDGDLDTTYKNSIDYDGYFNSSLCYTYSSSRFVAVSQASNHLCSGQWSGNFLNWATMTRMDLVRKVLYGGKRLSTQSSEGYTILTRAWLPFDTHSFVKTYSSTSEASVSQLTPYNQSGISLCSDATANQTSKSYVLSRDNQPTLKVAKGVWPLWATSEIWQCAWRWYFSLYEQPDTSQKLAELNVNVQVCDSVDVRTENQCKTYTNTSAKKKPIGLLQNYGETDQIEFGLITGSYYRNDKGGVLRKQVSSFMGTNKEVNPATGDFLYPDNSIIKVIDSLQIIGYSPWSYPGCGYGNGISSCVSWGNPLSEMYAEALRYLTITSSTKRTPTSSFMVGSNDNGYLDVTKWFGDISWGNSPWGNDALCSSCSILVLSSGENSYDMDNLNLADIPQLTLTKLKDYVNNVISPAENIKGKKFLVSDNNGIAAQCTTQTVTNLYDVRGICPDGAGNQAGYALAGLAYHAQHTDFHGDGIGIKTYGVALSENLPTFTFKTSSGNITVVPNCKSRNDTSYCSMNDIKVAEHTTDSSGNLSRVRLLIGWEDSPWGSDYDMDMVAEMIICVGATCNDGTAAGQIEITAGMPFKNSAASMRQGYTVLGSSNDGTTWLSQVTDYSVNKWTDINLLTVNRSSGYVTTRFTGSSQNQIAPLPLPIQLAAKYGGGENSLRADGTPTNYYKVNNFSELSTNLNEVFSEISQNVNYKASVTGSSSNDSEGSQIFYSSFDNANSWNGHLMAYHYDSSGNLVRDWDAASQLNNQTPNNRVFMTWDNTKMTGVPFRQANLNAWQQGQLTKSWNGSTTAIPLADAVQYLRGNHNLEEINGVDNIYRSRLNSDNQPTRLGDIVHSSAVYVGAPNYYYKDSIEGSANPYSTFKSQYADRTPVVYVGANDGALHAFSASSGTELLAYVPNATFPYLNQLMNPEYDDSNLHHYFVDDTPTVVDAYVNSKWRTVLAGGMRAGGKAVYALDVSNPNNFTETNAASTVMWEFDDSVDSTLLNIGNTSGSLVPARLGYTFSKPAIVRLNNGRWAAVFGNGYYSEAQMAVLYIVYLDAARDGAWTTSDVYRIYANNSYTDTSKTGPSVDNGLSNIAPIDTNDDGSIDLIYAGDLQGNMWRFDLSGTTQSSWKAYKVFQATYNGTVQPIVARPEVGLGTITATQTNTSYIVYFGTGKYHDTDDISSTSLASVQSFYAIRDVPSANRDILSNPYNLSVYTTTSLTNDYRAVALTSSGTDGWRLNLPAGEKVIDAGILRRGAITFTTIEPNVSQCAVDEFGWLMSLDAESGGNNSNVFDTNSDGVIDSTDQINGQNASGIHLDTSAGALLVDNSAKAGSQTAVSVDADGNPVNTTLAHDTLYRQQRVNWQQVFPPQE